MNVYRLNCDLHKRVYWVSKDVQGFSVARSKDYPLPESFGERDMHRKFRALGYSYVGTVGERWEHEFSRVIDTTKKPVGI